MFWPLIYVIPKNLLSRLVGRLVRIRWPWPLNQLLIKAFAHRYRINLSEAEHPVEHYRSIQELFTRRLQPGARPLNRAPVVHPADAELTVVERIHRNLLLQVKGWTYTVNEFLGEQTQEFEGGTQATYYLCPTDYHRVHAPVAGDIEKVRYIPGDLWPVNKWSVTHIPRLFARNERVVIWIKTAQGPVALVMVGATNVGQMSLSFDPDLISNVGQPQRVKAYPSGAVRVEKGEEVGVFNMGSTVVMLYPSTFPIAGRFELPLKTRLGEALLSR